LKLSTTYRHITAIIFFAAFLAQTFSRSFVLADYFANTAKYAKSCVNKARPKMHCNGKCQMMKKIQQEEKQDQENPDRKSDNKTELILSSKSFFAVLNNIHFTTYKKPLFQTEADGYTFNCAFSIFHPPRV
jgi:hypothetical protein